MGEFASELRRRVLTAEQSLLQARSEGDDYLQSVRTGELESLQRLAATHGIAVARSIATSSPIPEQVVDLRGVGLPEVDLSAEQERIAG